MKKLLYLLALLPALASAQPMGPFLFQKAGMTQGDIDAAVASALGGLATTYVNVPGDTMTGNLNISGADLDVDGQATFGNAPTKSTFTAAGVLQLSSTIEMENGTQVEFKNAAGTLRTVLRVNSSDQTILNSQDGDINFQTSGAGKARILNSGEFGIGTTAPDALLHVEGAAQFGAGATKSTFTALGSLSVLGVENSSHTVSGRSTWTGAAGSTTGQKFNGFTGVAPSTITLSTADCRDGQELFIKDESGTAGAAAHITLNPEGAATIDGADTINIVTAYGGVGVYCDGTNWFGR